MDSHAPLVISAPPVIRRNLTGCVPNALGTHETLRRLFSSAQRTLKIFAPFVDATFTSLLQLARCPVRVVTTRQERRRTKRRPVLERCAQTHPLVVKYLTEVLGGAHMFQVHAKMVIADRTAAYIGSANLTDTSLNYNLELGVLVRDPKVVADLESIFDVVFQRHSVPSGSL